MDIKKESNSRLYAEVGMILKLDDNTKKVIENFPIPTNKKGENMTRIPLDKTHITLTSISAFNNIPNKELFSTLDIEIPKVILGGAKFVHRGENKDDRRYLSTGKTTYVISIENQAEIRNYVNKLYEAMGIKNPEPNRFFHITIANNAGGNSFESIGNVDVVDFIQVWFDLDGVLADMQGSLDGNDELRTLRGKLDKVVEDKFPNLAGLSNDELKERFKIGLEQDPDNTDLKDLKKAYREYNNYVFKIAGKKGFYANLDLMPGAIGLVEEANKIVGKKPNILTAPAGNENDPKNPSVIEKEQWAKYNFGDLVDHIEITIDKGRVVNSKYDILIDDRTKYVDKFTSAGGSAILYKDATQAATELQKLYDELTFK